MKNRVWSDVKFVEAEGFRDGTQGVSPAAALEEINAQFKQRQEQENYNCTEFIKTLEARVSHLGQSKADAERHWSDLEYATGGMPPRITLPLCAVVCSALAVVGEAGLLAPVMDGLGIAERSLQYLMAAVLVITCSGLVEITKRQFRHPDTAAGGQREERRNDAGGAAMKCFFIALTLLTLAFVSFLGWWRAEEMIFAASEQGGAWREFLSQNPTLTRVLVTLLTTGLPVFVALAFEWGLEGLRLSWEWRKTRHAFRRYSKRLDKIRKALEAETEKKESRLRLLGEMREEWRQVYVQNHELGQKVGARRLPLWRAVLKIVTVALLLLTACLLLDPWLEGYIASVISRGVIYACAVLGLGGVYAASAIKAWDRPTPRQLYENRATLWRDPKGTEYRAEVGVGAPGNNGAGRPAGAGEHSLSLR